MLYTEDYIWKAVNINKFKELIREAENLFGDDLAHINADSLSNNIILLDNEFRSIGYIDIACEEIEDMRDIYNYYIDRDGLEDDNE